MTYPASVLALSKNWKLTLPTGGSHDPTEIMQPRLATYSDSSFQTSGAHVLFTAKCGGVTTSNSGYPRSELREMRNNGTDLAAWSSKTGTHVMTLDQAFTHLPKAKPEVVGGQIHGATDDVTVCRCEGRDNNPDTPKKLYITRGDDTHYRLLTASYVLGTRFTIQFSAGPSGIAYNYNSGAVTGTVPVTGSGWYFKAGCYTQSNPDHGDSPSAYGQVAMWGLTMGALPPKPVRPAAPTPPPDPENPCGG